MSFFLYTPCDAGLSALVCDDCSAGETARIRAVAFVKKRVLAGAPDLSDPLVWKAWILNEDAVVVPNVRGAYDGSTEVVAEGYGSQLNRVTGLTHVVEYFQLMRCENVAAYNKIKRNRDLVFFFRTENSLWHSLNAVKVFPQMPVELDMGKEIELKVTVEWSHPDLPECIVPPPGVFDDCAALAALLEEDEQSPLE